MALSQRTTDVIRPDFAFLAEVEGASGQAVSGCYRCMKCSAGCPMAEEMDFPPDRLVRMVQLGLKEEVLRGSAIWLCSGCLACSDRCPNGIDVARMLDCLKQMAVRQGFPAGERGIAAFHRSFLAVVKRYGRMHEATLIALLKLDSRDLLGDVGVGLRMLLKGKIPLLPQRVRSGKAIADLFRGRIGSGGGAGP